MPDLEYAATLWLRSRHPGVRVVNALPSDLEERLPLLFVAVVPGGGDDGVSGENALDVQAFAETRTLMWELAGAAHESMLAARGRLAGGLVIDDVATDSMPGHVPYNNPAVERTVSSYRLTHRVAART
ncbi:hypothetical protein RM572_21980 [Streptomyces sp. DSM 42041]|uniref:Tail terminator n=1 Tax=Streptomyces hazeniae TaxID=3075538 RepID=A0ABU2NWR2_9ACTN|nr:hypothetical protein [Streptomyces sp. DSM 42041]MDT0381432.1 hypothetical protein [Streptomyces sp. DSM 42041]